MKTILITLAILSSCSLFSQKVQYTYDATGNRVKRNPCTACRITTLPVVDEGKAYQQLNVANLNATGLPNPTKEAVTIKVEQKNSEESKFHVLVYDVYGREIINEIQYNTSFKLNLLNQIAGIYFVKVIAGDKVTQLEIIKE